MLHCSRGITMNVSIIVLQEMLREHNAMFWIDTSVRFTTSKTLIEAIGSRDIVLFKHMGHSIFAATNVNMYKYLPMSKSSAVGVSIWGAGAMYLRRSRQVNAETTMS
jgi:hypothetical protein